MAYDACEPCPPPFSLPSYESEKADPPLPAPAYPDLTVAGGTTDIRTGAVVVGNTSQPQKSPLKDKPKQVFRL